MNKRRLQSGFSMIEVLIITAIIGILIILAITMLPKQITKARDSRRKSDLSKIKIAFENYYSDNDCYPTDPDILANCGGTELAPYLANIPCDPQTKKKYLYAPEGDSCPNYYRVFANLEVPTDPVIEELGCHTASGCGAYAFFGEDLDIGIEAIEYDYGVSEGVPVYVTGGEAPSLDSGWCCNSGVCNSWIKDGENICTSPEIYIGPDECRCVCEGICN